MTIIVSVFALVAAVLMFLMGFLDLLSNLGVSRATKKAILKAATTAQDVNQSTDSLQAQSATDFAGAWEGLASLATALKDLDRATRLFVLALAFLAVSAVSSGASVVVDAINK